MLTFFPYKSCSLKTSRLPSFHARVLCEDDLLFHNKTAETISMKSLRPATPIKRRERLHPRTGKYSYMTQNVFEQELYFGKYKGNES